MPIVKIDLVKGRDEKDIEQCIRNVAVTVSESLNAPIESVRVMVNEYEPNRFAVGNKLKSES